MIAKKALRGKFFYERREFRCLSVERRFERDLEALKRVLNVETELETDFGGANEKLHVHAILGLGRDMANFNDVCYNLRGGVGLCGKYFCC